MSLGTLPATAFETAVPGRQFAFPRDHGKHPGFATEWWYFTGNLTSDKQPWGFQLTFFRRSLVNEPPPRHSRWAVRDVYPAHFAITDVANKDFFHTDLISREGPGLAGSQDADLAVRVRDWRAERKGEEIHIEARQGDYALQLKLTPAKPPVLHGNGGYSQKGDTEGQASYYYSFTRLQASGSLTFKGVTHPVEGTAWMDHEFGSSILSADEVGWDWFSLQLDDKSELMVFHLRKKDGTAARAFGTFVPSDGSPIDLGDRLIRIDSSGTWISPRNKAKYPSSWTVEIPSEGLTLNVSPLVADQELVTGRSTQVTYWEGAVEVSGTRNGKPVQGRGYVELTGYARGLNERL
jgi:predicted secreted hydrolase